MQKYIKTHFLIWLKNKMPTSRKRWMNNAHHNWVVLFFIPADKCRDRGEEFA